MIGSGFQFLRCNTKPTYKLNKEPQPPIQYHCVYNGEKGKACGSRDIEGNA